MQLIHYLAIKILRSKNQSRLLSFLAWFSLAGIAVSTAVFLFVQAIMLGFTRDLEQKLVGFSAHYTFNLASDTDPNPLLSALTQDSQFEYFAPYREAQGILQSVLDEESGEGVQIRAVDPNHLGKWQELQVNFSNGTNFAELNKLQANLPGILVGEELAHNLALLPEMGEEIDLIFPFGDVSPAGEFIPTNKRFRLLGTFKTGYYQNDAKYVIIGLNYAANFFPEDAHSKIGAWLKGGIDASLNAAELNHWQQQLTGVSSITTWQEQNHKLLGAFKMERQAMRLVLAMMVLFASFNIISVMLLLSYEQQSHLAILQSLGFSSKRAQALMLCVGAYLGLIGSILGIILGLLAIYVVKLNHISMPAPYNVKELTVHFSFTMLALATLLGLVMGLLAAWYPALQAGRMSVIKNLRAL